MQLALGISINSILYWTYKTANCANFANFLVVIGWLTLPTTIKRNLSLNLVDAENERDMLSLPIFAS